MWKEVQNTMNSSLIKSITLPLVVGFLASLLTRNSMEIFSAVNKPPLSPPAILFPIVWTILYTLMGIGYYLVVNSDGDKEDIQVATRIYGLQLIVNFLWTTFFFNFQWYLFIHAAVLEIVENLIIIIRTKIHKNSSHTKENKYH